MQRRDLLRAALGGSLLATLPRRALALEPRPKFERDPFTLGVASGYPTASSVVLWTRLAPWPLAPDGGMPPVTVPVRWELARDAGFRSVIDSGVAYAEAAWGHSVHVEPQGLESGRPYWYRFTAGDARSATGRTWTAPAAGATLERLRLAVASCQQYEHGYYTAYQQMLRDEPDLVVHLGDYIYERSWGNVSVRHHGAGECYSLGDYRVRHALYRTDADLQAAHALCPWLLTWDDHEVDNDYAGDAAEEAQDPPWMATRRAAAYQAYYEHMPLPRCALPFGASMHLYARRSFGNLATILLLDERQYRDPQACPAAGRGGGQRLRPSACPQLADPGRSMLGRRQEDWLDAQLASVGTRWNLLAQGVPMMHVDEDPGHGGQYWSDGWNGYPAARERLLHSLRLHAVPNPLVLSGDIHAFMAGELQLGGARGPETVASELVTTSISSQATHESILRAIRDHNANVLLADGSHRGYLRLDLTERQLRVDLVAVDTVAEPQSDSRVLRSYVLEDGRRGLQSA
jgi:alkaline phosphatase D